jgi:hypothetical protein
MQLLRIVELCGLWCRSRNVAKAAAATVDAAAVAHVVGCALAVHDEPY